MTTAPALFCITLIKQQASRYDPLTYGEDDSLVVKTQPWILGQIYWWKIRKVVFLLQIRLRDNMPKSEGVLVTLNHILTKTDGFGCPFLHIYYQAHFLKSKAPLFLYFWLAVMCSYPSSSTGEKYCYSVTVTEWFKCPKNKRPSGLSFYILCFCDYN